MVGRWTNVASDINYKPKCICSHNFVGYINRFNAYLLLTQAYKFISKSIFSLLVNANSDINAKY